MMATKADCHTVNAFQQSKLRWLWKIKGGGALAGNIQLAAKQGQHTPMRNPQRTTAVDQFWFFSEVEVSS